MNNLGKDGGEPVCKADEGVEEPRSFREQIEDMLPDAPKSFVDEVAETIYTFFVAEGHEMEDENPILVVRPLPQIDMVNGAPGVGINYNLVVTALTNVSDMNIGNSGSCFLFHSHAAMQHARENLSNPAFAGNVAWAYTPGRVGLNLGLPPQPYCLQTVMITNYASAKRQLSHDYFNFFQA